MTEPYEVPKHEINAELILPGVEPRRIRLFLAERAERHSGRERPSDLLTVSEASFFAIREPEGDVALVRRDAVVVLSVPASAEAGPERVLQPAGGEADASSDVALVETVRVQMEDGREVEGTIREMMPTGERRILDYLNRADPFVPLRDGDTIRFVNRARISCVTFA